jgi:hypothetical protein
MRKAADFLSTKPAPAAEEHLGEAHPVYRAERDLRGSLRQIAFLSVFLVTLRLLDRTGAAGPYIALGAVALVVLLARAAALFVLRHERVLDAIADGWELAPVGSIRRARKRLLTPQRRKAYAEQLEQNVRLLASVGQGAGAARCGDAGAERELQTVADLLRRSDLESARGVALCERLLHDGLRSTLYGTDMEALRRELGRIRFFLVQ